MILQHRLEEKDDKPKIEVITKYQALPIIHCYPGQLNQVFMHLLDNAIDAVRERCKIVKPGSRETICSCPCVQPQVMIQTESIEDQQIKIKIADNGCGIKKDILPKIFDPFFTTKPVGTATGLGLAISYQVVVKKHRGKLCFNSTLGKGSEFIVQIPTQQS